MITITTTTTKAELASDDDGTSNDNYDEEGVGCSNVDDYFHV